MLKYTLMDENGKNESTWYSSYYITLSHYHISHLSFRGENVEKRKQVFIYERKILNGINFIKYQNTI